MAEASLEVAVELRLRQFWTKERVVGDLRARGVSADDASELVAEVWSRVRDDLAQDTLRSLARTLVLLTMCAFMTYLLAANAVDPSRFSLVLIFLVIFVFLVGVFVLTALVQMFRLVLTRV